VWLAAGVAVLVAAALAIPVARRWPGGRAPSAISGLPSIAVLPFVDLSTTKDQDYFCDGMTEELTAVLAGSEGLRVASRTSVFRYKGKQPDVRRIGEDLQVHAVLEGSVRVEASRILVTAQLVDTREGFHLWTNSYERDFSDVFQLQHEIAEAVAKSFRHELNATRRSLVRRRTDNPEAWHYYLRASQRLENGEPAKALEFFKAAAASDGDYALAWAGVAHAATVLTDWEEARPLDVLPQAADAAQRALALNPDLGEVQHAVALVRVFHGRDWAGAETAFRRALELDPTHPEVRYDYARLVLNPTGRFEQAIDELGRAIRFNPDANFLRNELAASYIYARKYEDASRELDTSLGVNRASPGTHVRLGMLAARRGRFEDALAHFRRANSIHRSAWALSHIGYTLARLGRRGEAENVRAELGTLSGGKIASDYYLAIVHAALGDKDRAFAALGRARAEQAPFLIWLGVDYRWDELRADPRFGALTREMRLD
jgi:serine/threonine-protein kinase